MHFILIFKKKTFNYEQINRELLNSPNAPSLISREAIKFDIFNLTAYIYPYNHIDHETYGYSYFADEKKLLLINGIVNVNHDIRNQDICKFFNDLNDSDDLIGDYQIIYINEKGNGFIKTPSLSIRQLFYYEDENCMVISTEIKLIVDGLQKFREAPFINHFDPEFFEDSIFREWIPRNSPQKTIFKGIQRILPQDIKYFLKGKVLIERKESIEVPEWFRDAFYKDRTKLYYKYYETLTNFAETNLIHLKPNLNKIIMGLTGGADSRLSVAILSKICKKHQIPLICYTAGQDTHPDVVIAKKIAKMLNIPHFHHFPINNLLPNSKEINDYAKTFYLSQGDWNSKDFVKYYKRKISSRLSPLNNESIPPSIGAYPVNESDLYQLGMDGFKKTDTAMILRTNRWYGRRILFNQNFFFPLFNTEYEMWFGLLYGEIGPDVHKEFVYEILNRSEPKLLKIPFAGDSLPQLDIEPYLTVFDSKVHDKESFLWDYNFVRNNLKPILYKKFNKLNKKDRSFLNLIGLNELDYLLNREIAKILNLYHEKQINLKECFKRLLKERLSKNYPKTKTMIKMTKQNRFPYNYLLQILMDFASVANKHSFKEIEKEIDLS